MPDDKVEGGGGKCVSPDDNAESGQQHSHQRTRPAAATRNMSSARVHCPTSTTFAFEVGRLGSLSPPTWPWPAQGSQVPQGIHKLPLIPQWTQDYVHSPISRHQFCSQKTFMVLSAIGGKLWQVSTQLWGSNLEGRAIGYCPFKISFN